MNIQNNPPRNNPDAVATEQGWRHPQTGELLVSIKGLEIPAAVNIEPIVESSELNESQEDEKSDTIVGELEVITTSLAGAQPLTVKVTLPGAANIVSGSIHWGDGSPDTALELFEPAEFNHTYPNVGECTLKVTATFKDGETQTVTNIVKITTPGAKRGPKPKAKTDGDTGTEAK